MVYKIRIKHYLHYVLLLLVVVTVLACNSDRAPECFRNMGGKTSYSVDVGAFTSIHVSAGIEVVIVQGGEQSVIVETGKNIKEYISAEVVNGELRLTNANNCNWVRDYNSTTITVTTPVLEKIYTATQFVVRSAGVLQFPSLYVQSGLISETASGTLDLDINCQNFVVEDNQNLYCNIKGRVKNLTVNFYSGDARFDGTGLVAQNAEIFHRSSNDIMLNATQKVSGTLYSTGNLILLNPQGVINVNSLYTGKVVYR